jgi:hypothetical protein
MAQKQSRFVSIKSLNRGLRSLKSLTIVQRMKKCLSFIFLLLVSIPIHAETTELGTGNHLALCATDYKKYMNREASADFFKAGYFSGAVQTTSEILVFLGKINATQPRTPRQENFVVAKYLDQHPEKWSQRAVNLIIEALMQAFPAPQASR